MNPYRPVAIVEAEIFAKSHGLEQIVIWSYRTGEGQDVTTWGEPLRHSALAAEAGNHVKKAAGYPLEKCSTLPLSLVSLFGDVDAALAPAIGAGRLDKATVLAVMFAIRDAVRARDPELAEQFIPRACEAAQPQGRPAAE